MLTGEGLDPWAIVPGLRRFRAIGRILAADANARLAHAELEHNKRFLSPIRYKDLRASDWDALVLPGGHRARGIRPYLENVELRPFVISMFDAESDRGALPAFSSASSAAVRACCASSSAILVSVFIMIDQSPNRRRLAFPAAIILPATLSGAGSGRSFEP